MTGLPARFAARPFVALLGLVLVPGLALAYFGLRGVAERENTLRTHYLATITLVRDRVVAEMSRREDGVRDLFKASGLHPAAATNALTATTWLENLTTAHPWLRTPFLMSAEAVVTGGAHAGVTERASDPLAAFPEAADRVAAAEAAEWAARADLDAALRHYREALATVPAGSRAALFILTRIGRTLFKLIRYADGIAVYRQVVAAPSGALDRHGRPFAVIALTQIVDGLNELDRPDGRARAEVELLDYVLNHPWGLDEGFGHYLRLALAAPGVAGSTPADRGRRITDAVSDLEWLRQEVQARLNADLGPLSGDGERTGHLAVERAGESGLIGYHYIQHRASRLSSSATRFSAIHCRNSCSMAFSRLSISAVRPRSG
jgi:hypothetical protein